MVALFAAFRLPAYSGPGLAAVAALLWGFAPAGLCLTYLLQAAFEVGRRRVAGMDAPVPAGFHFACCRLCHAGPSSAPPCALVVG